MSALKRFQKFLYAPAEWVWIQEAKLGDKEAFGRLYQYYVDKIYRFCYFRVGQSRALAEDITADVFVKAWEKLDTFKKGSFQAWVYMIARNTIIDYYRSEKEKVGLTEDIQEEAISVYESVAKSLEIERVMKGLQFLTKEQQEIILLKFVEDLDNSEIAKIMNKSEVAIRALQSRAIKKLREKIV